MNVFINEDVARDYDSFYMTEPGISIDRLEKEALLALIDKLPRQAMLEIGCGTGHWSEFFAGLGFSVRAADLSDAMLAIAKTKNIQDVEFEKADALALPYPDSSFGFVASVTMLEFTGNIPLAINEMTRVLQPGGWLLLGCINANSVIGKTKDNDPVFREARFLNQAELHELLSEIGSPEIRQCVHLSESFELLDGTGREQTAGAAFMAALVQKTIDR